MDELLAVEREQLRWLRFLALKQVREAVAATLRTTAERTAFDLSDGRAGKDVAAGAGVSAASVSGWWKKWRAAGIAFEGEGRRTVHIAGLVELGLSAVFAGPDDAVAEDPDARDI